MQIVRLRREFDRSETPVYLFLNRKSDQFLSLFRVEVSETVFSSGPVDRVINADFDGTGSLDRKVSAKIARPDHRPR